MRKTVLASEYRRCMIVVWRYCVLRIRLDALAHVVLDGEVTAEARRCEAWLRNVFHVPLSVDLLEFSSGRVYRYVSRMDVFVQDVNGWLEEVGYEESLRSSLEGDMRKGKLIGPVERLARIRKCLRLRRGHLYWGYVCCIVRVVNNAIENDEIFYVQ